MGMFGIFDVFELLANKIILSKKMWLIIIAILIVIVLFSPFFPLISDDSSNSSTSLSERLKLSGIEQIKIVFNNFNY